MRFRSKALVEDRTPVLRRALGALLLAAALALAIAAAGAVQAIESAPTVQMW